MTDRRLRVAVVFGGRSEEHEVSVVSAGSVIAAMPPERYDVIAVGIDKAGRWHLLDGPPQLEGGASGLPAVEPQPGGEVSLARQVGARELVTETGRREPIDVVFPVLHGPFGEDGTIQGLLELAGVPYVGAGVLASAVGMDKSVAKVLFAEAGLPQTAYEVVTERAWGEDPESLAARIKALGWPVFVKPAALGSSVGITKVADDQGLAPALDEAFRHGRKALVEAAVPDAREIECAVLGNDDPVASVPGEIVPAGEFYDYRSKYLDDATELIVPADLPDGTVDEVQRMAVAAFEAIDCAGMARVDFFLGSTGGSAGGPGGSPGRLLLNEINTIPGFTSVSMYPKMWEASGLSYPDLIDRLIALALERHE